MSGGDLLIVSPATTAGWRANEAELTGSLSRLGVPHRVRRIETGPSRHLRRSGWWPVVDAVEAAAARRALHGAASEARPAAVILMSATAALLAPVGRLERDGIRVAVRLDCPAAANRPGPQNAIQRALERRRLSAATLAIATGPRSAALVAPLCRRAVEVPVAVDVIPAAVRPGGADLLAYVDDPETKGLDLICAAWGACAAEAAGALHVSGVTPQRARRFLRRRGIDEPPRVEWHGPLPRSAHLEILRGAAAYVSASAWEGAGIAQLEALAAGVPLVTTPARGAYEAEPIARELDPALVTSGRDGAELGLALRRALAMTPEARERYAAGARAAVEPFGRAAADRALRDEVLPALLG